MASSSKHKAQIEFSAVDNTRGVMGSVKNAIVGIGLAYTGWRIAKDVIGASISKAVDYQATMKSLNAVVKATGRDMNDVYAEMETHLGGLADKAQVAEGFLKGMTTTLNVDQISKMTAAVRDASLAMGEDFGVQLPLIIKAVKQLNPAILDNIGVTVRLDEVNKRIRDGFYGVNTAVNEATQQQAIFQEIMKQTAIFQGQEKAMLETNKGAWMALTAATSDAMIEIGTALTDGDTWVGIMNALAGGIRLAATYLTTFGTHSMKIFELAVNAVVAWYNTFANAFKNAATILTSFSSMLALAMAGQFSAATALFDKMIVDIAIGTVEMLRNVNAASVATSQTVQAAVFAHVDSLIAGFKAATKASNDAQEATGGAIVETATHTAEQLKLINEMRFKAGLIGMTEYQQDLAAIENDRLLRNIALNDKLKGLEEELAMALQESAMIANEERRILHDEYTQALADMYLERWAFITSAVTQFSQEMVEVLGTDTQRMVDVIKVGFEAMQKSIVNALVKKGLDAIWKFIAGEAAMKVATKLLGAETAAETIVQGVNTAAKTVATAATAGLAAVTTTAAVATSALATASKLAVAMMTTEAIAARALTKQYVALAAAKAAASLGTATPLIIAAAATTKAALSKMLTGFDDPLNDAMGFRHGADYADKFLTGARSRFDAPRFANFITDIDPVRPAAGGAVSVNVNVAGNIVADDDWVSNSLIPAIENAVQSGRSTLALQGDNLTDGMEMA